MGSMSASDAAPLPRLGEVFFDVRGESRTMRLSWYADTGVAVFSIWQGGTCTGTFRLPIADLPRMVEALQRGPHGHDDQVTGEQPGSREPRLPAAPGPPPPRPELDRDIGTGQTTAVHAPPAGPDLTGYQAPPDPAGYRAGPEVTGYQAGPELTGYQAPPDRRLPGRARGDGLPGRTGTDRLPGRAGRARPGRATRPGRNRPATRPSRPSPATPPSHPPATGTSRWPATRGTRQPRGRSPATAPRPRAGGADRRPRPRSRPRRAGGAATPLRPVIPASTRRAWRQASPMSTRPSRRRQTSPPRAAPGAAGGSRTTDPAGYLDEPPAPDLPHEYPSGYRAEPEPGYPGEAPEGYLTERGYLDEEFWSRTIPGSTATTRSIRMTWPPPSTARPHGPTRRTLPAPMSPSPTRHPNRPSGADGAGPGPLPIPSLMGRRPTVARQGNRNGIPRSIDFRSAMP